MVFEVAGKHSYRKWVLAAFTGMLACASPPANAASFTFDYDFVSGDTPAGTKPWLTAVITDGVPGSNQVTITLTSSLASGEFFPGLSEAQGSTIAFNIKDPIPTPIVFPNTGACDPLLPGCRATPPRSQEITNGINLPGDAFSGFDLGLLLGDAPDTFSASNVLTYTLIANGLTASSFITTNSPGSGQAGNYCSAARVFGIGPSNGTAVIAASCNDTPPPNPSSVPGPLPILGAGMMFGFSRRLRRRVQASADSN